MAELAAVRMALSPSRWDRLANLQALRQESLGRGWIQPGDYLGKLAATMAAPGQGFADSVDRVLIVEPRAEKAERDIEPIWQQLDTDTRKMEKTGDGALAAFARALRRSVGKTVTLGDEGFVGLDALTANAALAARFVKTIPGDWPANIDSKRLEIDTAANVNLAQPRPADMEWWLKNMPLYAVRRAETSLAAAALSRRLKEIDELVAKSQPEAEDKASLRPLRGRRWCRESTTCKKRLSSRRSLRRGTRCLEADGD